MSSFTTWKDMKFWRTEFLRWYHHGKWDSSETKDSTMSTWTLWPLLNDEETQRSWDLTCTLYALVKYIGPHHKSIFRKYVFISWRKCNKGSLSILPLTLKLRKRDKEGKELRWVKQDENEGKRGWGFSYIGHVENGLAVHAKHRFYDTKNIRSKL